MVECFPRAFGDLVDAVERDVDAAVFVRGERRLPHLTLPQSPDGDRMSGLFDVAVVGTERFLCPVEVIPDDAHAGRVGASDDYPVAVVAGPAVARLAYARVEIKPQGVFQGPHPSQVSFGLSARPIQTRNCWQTQHCDELVTR